MSTGNASASNPPNSGPRSTVRAKATTPDQVLPPAKDLVDRRPDRLNYTDIDGVLVSREYDSFLDADHYPIPMPIDREGYGSVEDSAGYWSSGIGDMLNVVQALDRHSAAPSENRRKWLDFGCASGRVLRHVGAHLAENFEAWGCDFAPANVNWAKRHLNPDLKVFVNTDVPHLPFPDGHFDVVTAFSVFTHIDILEDAWLLELRRITSPEGLLYLTVHNGATWSKVVDRPYSLTHLMRANNIEGNPVVDAQLFGNPMEGERVVLRMSTEDLYNCNVWVSDDYLRKAWGRYLEIVHIADNAHSSYQSVVIARPL